MIHHKPTREQYADDLVPLAARVVGAVHDEGPQGVRDALTAAVSLPAPDHVDPHDALVTILAAMVDPNQSPRDLLAWTRPVEGGTTALQPTLNRPTGNRAAGPRSNPLAVEMSLAGRLPLHALAQHERHQVVAQLQGRRWSVDAIAEYLDADADDVRQYIPERRAAA